MRYFITANGLTSGKTIVSAIITKALHADYWKPIQTGVPKDTDKVKYLVNNNKSLFFKEAYFLTKRDVPYAAAKHDGIEINIDFIKIPNTENHLVIEGTGGILTPICKDKFMLDLVKYLDAEVIIVADQYKGTINHTLLTIEYLKKKKITIKGIVFYGRKNLEYEEIILNHSGLPCLLKINSTKDLDEHQINEYAIEFLNNWKN